MFGRKAEAAATHVQCMFLLRMRPCFWYPGREFLELRFGICSDSVGTTKKFSKVVTYNMDILIFFPFACLSYIPTKVPTTAR